MAATTHRTSLVLNIASTLMTFVVISIAIGRFGSVPDPMPIHFGANGQPDGFQPKTWGGYLAAYLILGAIFLGIQWGMWAFQRYGEGQTLRDRSSREATLPWVQIFLLIVFAAVFFALLASMSFQYYAAWPFIFVMAVTVVGSIAIIVVLSRKQRDIDKKLPPTTYQLDKMKYGFYFDADDQRILIPTNDDHSHFTFNLSKPMSWCVMAALFSPGILVVLLVWLN